MVSNMNTTRPKTKSYQVIPKPSIILSTAAFTLSLNCAFSIMLINSQCHCLRFWVFCSFVADVLHKIADTPFKKQKKHLLLITFSHVSALPSFQEASGFLYTICSKFWSLPSVRPRLNLFFFLLITELLHTSTASHSFPLVSSTCYHPEGFSSMCKISSG